MYKNFTNCVLYTYLIAIDGRFFLYFIGVSKQRISIYATKEFWSKNI